ncbi:MAG: hypothetical protein SFU85_12095 [Candidatus Methylacidiphilales bacterium]|nr:hypothetical protein [Candidatus Methylacidiphilales bacterium]
MFPEIPPEERGYTEWEVKQLMKDEWAKRKLSWSEKLALGFAYGFILIVGFVILSGLLLYVFSPEGHWVLICIALFCSVFVILWAKETFPNTWKWMSKIFFEWPLTIVGAILGFALVAGLIWGALALLRFALRSFILN